jgi:hypothetical protein
VALPEVKEALAASLRNGETLRAAQRLIVTSLLYTAPATPPADAMDETDPPPWSMGPTKLLVGEDWLAAVGAVVDETLGSCDYRFLRAPHAKAAIEPRSDGYDPRLVPGELESPEPTLTSGGWSGVKFREAAKALGGCNPGGARAVFPNLQMASAQHRIAKFACGYGRGVLPPDFRPGDTSDDALLRAARFVSIRTLVTEPNAEEEDALLREMRDCLAAKDGCAGAEEAVRWICERVVDSAAFALY